MTFTRARIRKTKAPPTNAITSIKAPIATSIVVATIATNSTSTALPVPAAAAAAVAVGVGDADDVAAAVALHVPNH